MELSTNFDRHSSAVGLFMTVTMVVASFGGLAARMLHFPSWLSISGLVICSLVTAAVIISGLKSHFVSILCGLITGVALVPLIASIVVS